MIPRTPAAYFGLIGHSITFKTADDKHHEGIVDGFSTDILGKTHVYIRKDFDLYTAPFNITMLRPQ